QAPALPWRAPDDRQRRREHRQDVRDHEPRSDPRHLRDARRGDRGAAGRARGVAAAVAPGALPQALGFLPARGLALALVAAGAAFGLALARGLRAVVPPLASRALTASRLALSALIRSGTGACSSSRAGCTAICSPAALRSIRASTSSRYSSR